MKYMLVILLVIILSMSAYAQSNFFGMTYDVSIPQDDTQEAFDSGAQWRGMGLEGRWYLNKSTSLGFSWDWNVFHHVMLETVQLEHGAVTGYQNRTLNAFPFLATGHYYLEGGSTVQPYFGLGAGAFYIIRGFDLGILSTETNAWQFGLAPEIGFLFPVDMGFNILLKLKYNYAFESGDHKSVSYIGINLGYAAISLW
jgi:hypothetical protein